MHRSHRQRLLARLLDATGATSVGLVFAAACGGNVAHEAGPGPGGGTSTGGAMSTGGNVIVIGDPGGTQATEPMPQPLRQCLSLIADSAGGAESDAAAGAGGALAGAGGAVGAATARCPTDAEAKTLLDGQGGLKCRQVYEVNAGPILEQGQCCYDVQVTTSGCYVGRAFLVEEGFLKSTVRKGGGWTHGATPQVSDLSPKTRRALADAWAKDGLFEHASVATFARFAIQLLAVGAPARLLHETLAAGRDEIRHAELCFALASAYAGEPLEADCFPIGDTLQIDRTLPAIVMETVVEGCIGETLAAMQAAAQLELASDPAVVAALESTIEDESRHAELAWRVVTWAVRTGGPEVRTAAERAFAGFRPPSPPELDLEDVCLASFAAHGRLSAEHARAIALEALDSIVRPCAAALLERSVMPESVAYA